MLVWKGWKFFFADIKGFLSLVQYLILFVAFLFSQPSEQSTYADIEAAYRCLVETYGAHPEDIILYGQSVGSGPTLDLAVRLSQLRAVVLHSPILSGLRVMYPVKRTYWFDIYKVHFISSVDCVTYFYSYILRAHSCCHCRTLIKYHMSTVLFW